MRKFVCCAALVAMTMGVACGSGRAHDEAGLTLSGTVELVSASGAKSTVVGGRTIRAGETVKVAKGTATLEFSNDRRMELRQGSAVKVDRVPTVLTGDVLMLASATPLTIKSAGSSIALVDGAARLSRNLGFEAATYKGGLTITSAGRAVKVPELRQTAIASLSVGPAKPEPLRLQATNEWDRRFLGDAIELTEQLQARSDGLTGQLPAGEGRGVAFVARVMPDLVAQADFDQSLVDANRPPGEMVVGASIVAAGHANSVADRWRSVFSFRDQGAAWGLVALDQRVADVGGLSSTIDNALTLARDVTSKLLGTPSAEAEAAAAAAAAVASIPPTVSAPPVVSAPSTTRPTPPPLPEAEPTPPPGPLQPVVDTVDNLLGGLLGPLGAKSHG